MKLMTAFVLAAVIAVPITAAVHADELGDAAAICEQHWHSPTGPLSGWKPFDAGWEHCAEIKSRHDARIRAVREADEATNPDLKKTRELSRRLAPAK